MNPQFVIVSLPNAAGLLCKRGDTSVVTAHRGTVSSMSQDTASELRPVSLAEAAWRTGLASTPAEMRVVALESGALLPGDLVNLDAFIGGPVAAVLPRVKILGAYKGAPHV